jgi:hypothetical protein
LILAARAQIAAVLFVQEQAILRLLQLGREFKPLDIERRFVKVEKALDHKCVIVGEALDIAATAAVVAIQNLASVVLFRSAQTRPVNQLPRHHHEPQVTDQTMHSFYPNIAWVTAEIDET